MTWSRRCSVWFNRPHEPTDRLGLLLAGLLYPFAVYFGMEHFAPWQFALLLGSLWLARALTGERKPGSLWMACVAMVFCLLLAVFDSPQLLRWYPVLISAFMLVLFGASMKYGPPMVERLARLREPELPQVAIRYTRKVTLARSVFSSATVCALRSSPCGRRWIGGCCTPA